MPFQLFFKYIYFMIIQMLAFATMYKENLELMGYGVGIIVSFVTAGFLWLDIYNSPKSSDPSLFVILLSMLGGIISLIIFANFLTKTHAKYNKKGSKIMLTRENRKILDKFKSLYMKEYFLIAMLSLMFFMVSKSKDGKTFLPFFEVPEQLISTNSIFFTFKVLVSIASLGISGYMIYLANELSKQNSNQLYIPEKDSTNVIYKFPYKKPNRFGFIEDISTFFRNVNLNYLMNYNINRSD
jgi:hypothetical protein